MKRLWRKLFGVPVPGYQCWWEGAGDQGIWCYRWEGMATGDSYAGGYTRFGTKLEARRRYRDLHRGSGVPTVDLRQVSALAKRMYGEQTRGIAGEWDDLADWQKLSWFREAAAELRVEL